MAVSVRHAAAPFPSHRLIPSQFPPIGLFDTVTRAADLEAVMDELVGLCHYANSMTSERIRRELAANLPRHHDIDLFSTSSVFTILTRAIIQAAQRREIQAVSDARALARQITVVINGFFLAHPNEPEKAAREARAVLKLMLQGLRSG